MVVVDPRRDDEATTSVLLDAWDLSADGAWSGIGTTIRGLLGAITEQVDIEVHAMVTAGVAVPEGVERVGIHRRFDGRRRGVVEHQLRLPLDLRRHRADVFHNPHPHPPRGVRGPWVQTLYDVIPLVFPDPNLDVLRKRWERFAPRYRRADHVVAISRHAADEGIRHLGLDPAKVEVVHLGANPELNPGTRDDDDPYVLVVSEYSRRKGFADAFAAIARLAAAGLPHRLKVAGRIPPHVADELRALVAAADRPDRIELLGFVDDLAAVYRAASLVLVPSRYEGFGLPALEAMASGVPVVAYDNSSLPEIVGAGGLLAPDGDAVALADLARRVLATPSLAAEQRERGLARAGELTWSATAAGYAEVYRAAAS